MNTTLTRAQLSPLGGRASQQRQYAVSFTAATSHGEKPATLTIWALGASLAVLLAERQAAAAGLTVIGKMTWAESTPAPA